MASSLDPIHGFLPRCELVVETISLTNQPAHLIVEASLRGMG